MKIVRSINRSNSTSETADRFCVDDLDPVTLESGVIVHINTENVGKIKKKEIKKIKKKPFHNM